MGAAGALRPLGGASECVDNGRAEVDNEPECGETLDLAECGGGVLRVGTSSEILEGTVPTGVTSILCTKNQSSIRHGRIVGRIGKPKNT